MWRRVNGLHCRKRWKGRRACNHDVGALIMEMPHERCGGVRMNSTVENGGVGREHATAMWVLSPCRGFVLGSPLKSSQLTTRERTHVVTTRPLAFDQEIRDLAAQCTRPLPDTSRPYLQAGGADFAKKEQKPHFGKEKDRPRVTF